MHDALDEQRGENGGEDGLAALQDDGAVLVEPAGCRLGRVAQEVWVDKGVDEGGDGQDDGEDGDGG